MNTDPEMSKELRGRLKDIHDRLERIEAEGISISYSNLSWGLAILLIMGACH
jgi:hypothetical protein